MDQQFWVTKLSPLVDRDFFIREGLLKKRVLADAYHPEMEKVHQENTRVLKYLIENYGFPVLSNAGKEGVKLSWLIIQHSISHPDFMQGALIDMRLAAAQDDYPKELLAYTEDRVAYFKGRDQLYGTNFDWQDGYLQPTPIQDKDHVEIRRKSMGLPPLAETLFKISDELPPKDPMKKIHDFEIWLKKTGWRV